MTQLYTTKKEQKPSTPAFFESNQPETEQSATHLEENMMRSSM